MKKNIFFLTILLLLTSCASHRIQLNSQEVKPLDEFSNVTTVSTDGNLSIWVDKFEDIRTLQSKIGEAKTGMFNSSTPITLNEPLGKYVADQIREGLKKRGIHVDSKSEFILRGKIKDFWVSETTTGWAPEQSKCYIKLDMALFEVGAEEPRWYGITWVKVFSPSSFLDTTKYNGDTMASAMNAIVEKLIHEKKFQMVTDIKVN